LAELHPVASFGYGDVVGRGQGVCSGRGVFVDKAAGGIQDQFQRLAMPSRHSQ